MIRRPRPSDTEDDLLALQRDFMESESKPAAGVARHGEGGRSEDTSPLRVGEKRRKEGLEVMEEEEEEEEEEELAKMSRDVVQLSAEGPGEGSRLGSGKPPTKKSRFKEQREGGRREGERGRAGDDKRVSFVDPHEAMERHDMHITRILADIKEHDTTSSPVVTMPTRRSKYGFPIAHKVSGEMLPGTGAAASGRTSAEESDQEEKKNGKTKKRKSLFAQQFEKFGPDHFGVSPRPPTAGLDRAEPVMLERAAALDPEPPLGRSKASKGACQEKEDDMEESTGGGATPISSRGSVTNTRLLGTVIQQAPAKVAPKTEVPASDQISHDLPLSMETNETARPSQLPYQQSGSQRLSTDQQLFESSPMAGWAGQLAGSSVVSGEGLIGAGTSREAALEEVKRIHRENEERLAEAAPEEVWAEQRRVRQLLGPDLVSFLQSRRVQRERERPDTGPLTGEGGGESSGDGGSEAVGGKDSCGDKRGGVEEPMEGEGGFSEDSGALQTPGGWLHMDVVEKDKLEWMKDVSLQSSTLSDDKGGGDREGKREVRFSLDGQVIPYGTIVPSHLGLHHHGDEPEAAGYTLTELVLLTRSAVLQQRTLGLHTLAVIIARAREGQYDGEVGDTVVPSLAGAGLPALLRYSLDDSTDSVMAAAVHAIHSLVVEQAAELLQDEYFDCYHGNKLPALKPRDWRRAKGEGPDRVKEIEECMTRGDYVQGYMHMNILPRLRYILEVCQLSLPVATQILEILTRICRHSTEAASEVVQCPRLVGTLVEEYLPLSWADVEQEGAVSVRGRPHAAALTVLLTACAAGRHLAARLVAKHKLLDVILRFGVPHPTDTPLPGEEAYRLSMAALRLWRTLLCYGMGAEALRDTYPIVLRQLHGLSSARPLSLSEWEARRVAALLMLVEAAINVGGVTAAELKQEGEEGELPALAFTWQHTSSLLPALLSSLSVWVAELGLGAQPWPALLCLAGLLHCLASYYCKLMAKLPASPLDVLEQIKALASGVMSALAQSSLITVCLQRLRASSMLVNQSQRLQSNMDGLGAANLLLGLLRLSVSAVTLHKGVADEATAILDHTHFVEYLEAVVEGAQTVCTCFQFTEFHLLYCAVKLFVVKLEVLPSNHSTGDAASLAVPLYHHVTFDLLGTLPPGTEFWVHELISSVAFHPQLLPEIFSASTESLVAKDVSSLTLKEPPQPIATMATPTSTSPSAVLVEVGRRLSAIRSSYLSAVEAGPCSKPALERSRSLLLRLPLSTASLLLPRFSYPFLHPDWIFLPLGNEYVHSQEIGSATADLEPSPEVVATVTNSLYLLLLLEHVRPRVLVKLPTALRVARLMDTFLIGNTLFLEETIHNCLLALLSVYCKPEMQKSLDFDFGVLMPGLISFGSFRDRYSSLLAQFAAVSYSDPLFASYVVLPLQQRFSVGLRRAVWDANPSVLRVLSLPLAQVPVGLDSFLVPDEEDEGLLEMYLRALASGEVRHHWSPLLYLVAVHHVHHFIFKEDSDCKPRAVSPLQQRMLLGVIQQRNRELKRDLMLYSGADNSVKGFRLGAKMSNSQRERVLLLAEEARLTDTSSIPGLL